MAYIYGAVRPLGLTEKLLRVHWPVVLCAAALAALGTAALYSVAGGSFQPWAERHALRFLVATALLLSLAMVRPEAWLNAAYPVYAAAVLLLALVPFAGVEALGAKRWLAFGQVSFQPSELMKLALVVALARYYQWLPQPLLSKPQWVAVPLAMILIPVLLTIKQPDLGSAALFAALGLGMMFLAGVSPLYFAGGAVAGAGALPLIFSRLHDYQRRRIDIFLDPEKDPLGAGYHITQAKIALGSGGLSGKGFLQGTQSQLDFVPEKHTDFIATTIGEEWGFVGLFVILTLFAVMIALLAMMSWRNRSQFGRLIIAGSALTFFIYVFINIAMVTGLVPVVGIPLPLISYGGTSMMTVMAGLGLAMSAYVHRDHAIRRDDIGMIW